MITYPPELLPSPDEGDEFEIVVINPAAGSDLLLAAEAALKRIESRRGENIDEWALRAARWMNETDFGEYE